jgi:hypothetical protein
VTTFRLQKSTGSNQAVTKFDVIDRTGAICGRITVPNEEADDLAKHWLGGAAQPKAAAAAGATAPARGKQNPMVSAMVAAAKKHPLNRAAVLRGC